MTTLGEDIGGVWGRNVINQAMNGMFIHLPTSPADIISVIGVNMGLDEGADKYPVGKKNSVNQCEIINCGYESIKGLKCVSDSKW